MGIFWPAVLLGAIFVAIGATMLSRPERSRQLLHERYTRAQERHPEVRLPGKNFLPLLSLTILGLGIIAVGLGLTSPLRG